ncbi:RidA family protein [Pseudomonas sp. o96-267]|uniref:RidA family protein n=1 Tax=Pseudomonas sp. o96-267 TaxID=2479853 RepID=UPI000F78B7E7|nr:RidA family protein [Pseudomonas sp. o96-267]RRV25306.1 RidA family protein [Pseudomonas sp. o96-267]
MSVQRIQTNDRLSGATIFSDLVFLSGQVPSDRSQDVAGQTAQVLEKIDALLTEAGSDRSHMLSAQIWLKDIEKDFVAMNAVWSDWLPAGCAPARATVEARLASADVLVEIMVIAVLKAA